MKTIAWDFDGVLNRNIVDGQFLWTRTFERDLGKPVRGFVQHVFADNFDAVITGREDLRDRVASWADLVGFADGPDVILDYWFRHDDLPDGDTIALLETLTRSGVRHVIATNNEARRAHYIAHTMQFDQKVDQIFASGRLGVAKPNPEFFRKITDTLETEPSDMILVDDIKANVDQALKLGWHAFHFSDETRMGLERYLEDHLR